MYTLIYRIDLNFIIKVGDFGLAESVGTKEYFRQNKITTVKLPLRWLALESLEDQVFSEKSDVVRNRYPYACTPTFPMLTSYCMFAPHAVGIWCDVLGDLYSRESSLFHCQFKGPSQNAEGWTSSGDTSQ